jgi:hypothetical protein
MVHGQWFTVVVLQCFAAVVLHSMEGQQSAVAEEEAACMAAVAATAITELSRQGHRRT